MKRGREIDSNRSHSERGCEIESSTTKGGTASRTREGSRGDAPRAHTYIFFLWLFNNNLIVFRHNWEGQATVGGAPAETGRTPTQARGPGGAAKTPEEHQRQDQLRQERGAKGSPPARTRPTTTGCRCRRGGTMGSHLRQRRPPTCSGGGVPPPCNRQLPFLFFHFFFFSFASCHLRNDVSPFPRMLEAHERLSLTFSTPPANSSRHFQGRTYEVPFFVHGHRSLIRDFE